MTAISGLVSWGIVPLDNNNSNLAGMSWGYRGNYLKSANDQIRYQVQYRYNNGALTEGTEVDITGGVVNVIFKIETSVDSINWDVIGVISKSRDVTNKRYDNDTSPALHRFTIDVSQLVSDQLSYSLCPINKGTWQSPFYGGMNGGITMQDNVIGNDSTFGTPVSLYNVSDNGTYRYLRVSATFGVLNANQEIVTATTASGSAEYVLPAPFVITVINSVNQFESDGVYYANQFLHDWSGVSLASPRRFNTRCPNWYWDDVANKVAYNKLVRMDEEAEFLQWYVKETRDSDYPDEYYNYSELYGTAYDYDGTETNFVMVDFNSLLSDRNSNEFDHQQNRMLVQNISPTFINNNAKVPETNGRPYDNSISPITANTHRYSFYFRGKYLNTSPAAWIEKTQSATVWYEIDRENENIPYGYVRFHWLNSMGGIDSYTAKRNIVEGLTINRSVVERKSGDRTWYQDDFGGVSGSPVGVPDSAYISDTTRGGDLYKGGREVLGVTADRVQSVYTEPLNKSVAKWLEELILSPNVWIEMDTEATQKGKLSNPYLRPSTKGYIPVIITNSDVESVNQENGLVKFNIEYTLAHKVQTQRN